MTRVGDLLGLILDEKIMNKAHEYSGLMKTWEALTKKHGIAAAAAHSRVVDLCKNVLFVDADHPGWIQILQTKEHKLLGDFQAAFPDLGISGIAFKLSKKPPGGAENGGEEEAPESGVDPGPAADTVDTAPAADPVAIADPAGPDKFFIYDQIKDEGLREALKSLEQSIKK
ncbi:MAG: DUF721 domain-containing protein [Treponema sp.]|jgi:hypothetical protein|nr:DUF721 domain-containing protein [Treponema sp.]